MGGRRREQKKLSWWQETFLLLALALATSIAVKAFFVQMFFVPSASMRPELIEDDRILVEKISSWDGEVDRGDVVVFQDPGGWLGATPEPTGPQELLSVIGLYPEGGHLVKRVVAVGGDKVACCDDEDRLTVNGVPLDEGSYLRRGTAPSEREFDVTVPDDAVWVMGDNRADSQDSRFHLDDPGGGSVPLDNVVGAVWAIVWPADRMERLEPPEGYASLGG
ncbi:MAG: signal peptidase I [Nocardioidaceae bacterium]